MSDPEALLKKIRKYDFNKICPNCGTQSPTFLGFGSICMKYKTFICDNCKTSHQAISHRCKSVSMSIWTMEEVQSLTAAKGGGNDVALQTWLGAYTYHYSSLTNYDCSQRSAIWKLILWWSETKARRQNWSLQTIHCWLLWAKAIFFWFLFHSFSAT